MLQGPPMAVLPLALLTLVAGLGVSAGAAGAPELCETEMNKIKDLLQVSCTEKGLRSLPAGLPKDTGLLLLGSNRLGRFSLASVRHLSQLSELSLSNNSLSALETGAPLPKLQLLDLSRNALEILPDFRGLPALTRLALGHNAIAQLPEGAFQELGRLQDLQLQGNRLRRLPPGAFQGLAELRDLDLSDNRLEALPLELLVGLELVEILRLERNRLQNLPDGFFPEENAFAYVYLAENPWRCDCKLAYLRAWIQENEISVYTRTQGAEKEITENEPESVKCQAPPREKGTPVMSFRADCRKLGDSDASEEEGETLETLKDTASTPAPTPSSITLHALPATFSAHPLRSATSVTPAATAPTTVTPVGIVPTTAPFRTTASTVASASAPAAAATATPSTLAPSSTALTTRPHTTAPGAPLVPVPSSAPAPLLPQGSAARPSATPVPATTTTPPPVTTLTAAGPLSTAAALTTLTPPADTPPGTSAPASASPPPAPPSPEPPAPCLCPALPVRSHRAAARRQSRPTWAGWLARHCCRLRLALYLACLALVVPPALAVPCCLGWVYLRWYRPVSQGASGARPVRCRQLQEARPPWQEARSAAAPGPSIYRVCKTFRVAPLRHISWLFVSRGGPAKPAGPWARREGSLSSYSLNRGRDALGAVRVRYTTASL